MGFLPPTKHWREGRGRTLLSDSKNPMALRQADKKKLHCPERSLLTWTWPSQTSRAHPWQMRENRKIPTPDAFTSRIRGAGQTHILLQRNHGHGSTRKWE
ncbi:hypothetical protein LZ554_004529 [Drepanopeziza brunnea f. sp. 'monogermtubi']|nr:hypothetical protein LZ554_004529 [Drepanopeziza brunnea f. sp. 'monogermtubi']